MELSDNEFDYRETANCEELTNLAVALFIGMAYELENGDIIYVPE